MTNGDWKDWDAWSKARLRWRLLTDQSRSNPRSNQLTPRGDWLTWLLQAGRGFGKTRAGAEDVSDFARKTPGARIAIVTGDFAEGRDVCIEGESGLLNIIPRSCVQAYNRSLGELVFTNGARVDLYSAEKPDDLRGPQHHRAWLDEMSKWRYLEATWDQLQFGLRLGDHPQSVITSTPKPIPLLREIAARDTTIVTRGSTFDNAANLAPSALDELRRRYEGTRLGHQELYGEFVDDLGSVFERRWFHLVDESPADHLWQRVRYWDLAGTPGSEDPHTRDPESDPDWTAGVLCAWDHVARHLVIEDVRHVRRAAGEVERLVLDTAREDGSQVPV